MRFRLPLLTAALISTLAFPSAAQADAPVQVGVAGALPCIDTVVVAVNCVPQPQPEPQPKPAGTCPGRDLLPSAANVRTVLDATLCLLNAERAKHGLGTLRPVPVLHSVAGAYAKRMVRERFFEHTSPDGGTFLSRIKRTSYLRGNLKRWAVGENLAWGTSDRSSPDKIVRAWMRSAGHRRNILDQRFNELGLGIALGTPKRGAGSTSAATYVNEFGHRRR